MSHYYCFNIRSTKREELYADQMYVNYDHENLAKVDEELIQFSGEPLDTKHYSHGFNDVVEAGFAMLMSQGGSCVEQKHFDWLMTKLPDLLPSQRAMLEYAFITGPWIFEAWG